MKERISFYNLLWCWFGITSLFLSFGLDLIQKNIVFGLDLYYFLAVFGLDLKICCIFVLDN